MFYNIRHQYGQHISTQLKTLANTYRKLTKIQNQKIFLLRCRKQKVFPTHIYAPFHNIINNLQTHIHIHTTLLNQIHRTMATILNLEISNIHTIIKQCNTIIININIFLTNILPTNTLENFIKRQTEYYNKTIEYTKTIHIRKFHSISHKQTHYTKPFQTKETWI